MVLFLTLDYVKFNYFHKEQKQSFKNNPFLIDNLFYNPVEDFFICPMGQKMELTGKSEKVSERGYKSEIFLYQAKRCEGCPLRGLCHKSKENRTIEVNHNLRRHKTIVRENLTSEKGLWHRSRRPIEPEAVFGQIKSNRRFNRFRLRGLDGVAEEFGLICIAVNLSKMIKKEIFQSISGLISLKIQLNNSIMELQIKVTKYLSNIFNNWFRFSAI